MTSSPLFIHSSPSLGNVLGLCSAKASLSDSGRGALCDHVLMSSIAAGLREREDSSDQVVREGQGGEVEGEGEGERACYNRSQVKLPVLNV